MLRGVWVSAIRDLIVSLAGIVATAFAIFSYFCLHNQLGIHEKRYGLFQWLFHQTKPFYTDAGFR